MKIETVRLTLNALTCWQITLKNGTPVGEIHCKGIPENGEIEIGYGINETKYRGRGYMKEALNAFCDNILADGTITSIRAVTNIENFTSQSVLQACGFSQCGRKGGDIIWRRSKPQP